MANGDMIVYTKPIFKAMGEYGLLNKTVNYHSDKCVSKMEGIWNIANKPIKIIANILYGFIILINNVYTPIVNSFIAYQQKKWM